MIFKNSKCNYNSEDEIKIKTNIDLYDKNGNKLVVVTPPPELIPEIFWTENKE